MWSAYLSLKSVTLGHTGHSGWGHIQPFLIRVEASREEGAVVLGVKDGFPSHDLMEQGVLCSSMS